MSTCSSSMRQYRHRKLLRQVYSTLVLSLLILASFSWFYWDWQSTHARVESLTFRPQVVQSGDTLWTLAEKSGIGIDTRTLVLKMMDYNKLADTNIRIGQVIYTPAPESRP